MLETVGFIGSGRIARIILGGWTKAGALPSNIVAYDANPAAVAALQADFPSVKIASLDEAAGADLVFGALHPPAMPEMLAAIAGKLKAQAVFCSLAPKVKLSALKEKLGGFGRLARMNPNSPSIIGEGYNPIAFADELPATARDQVLAVLKPLGQSPQVAENLLESYAVISAMGPTYFGFQFDSGQFLRPRSAGCSPSHSGDARRHRQPAFRQRSADRPGPRSGSGSPDGRIRGRNYPDVQKATRRDFRQVDQLISATLH